MKLFFVLIRNTLSIPDTSPSLIGLAVSQYGKAEQLVDGMKKTRLLEFIMVGASSCDVDPFIGHALIFGEIFQLIFSLFPPELVAQVHIVFK